MMKKTSWFSKNPSIAFSLSMLAVSILPLLCGWIFYARSSAVVHAQQESIVNQSMELSMQQLDTDIQSIINTSLSLRTQLSGLDMPHDEADFSLDHRMRFFETRQILTDFQSMGSNILKNLYIIRPDADYAITPTAMVSRENLYNRFWAPYGISEKEFSLMHMHYETGAIINLHQSRPVFLLTISKDYKTGLPTKQLVLVLNENYFSALFSRYKLPGVAYSFYGPDNSLLFQSNTLPEKAQQLSMISSLGKYKLVAHIPQSYYLQNTNMLRMLYLSMLAGTLLISALLIFSLARRNAMPINKIISYIQENYKTAENEENVAGLNLIQSSIERMLQEHDMHQQQLSAYQEREEMRILGNVLLGLTKELPEPNETIAAFAVALFPLSDDHDPDLVKAAVSSWSAGQFMTRCVFLSGDLFLLLYKNDEPMSEEDVAGTLESLLLSLDEKGLPNLRCTVSLVHTSLDEMDLAYREAVMAGEYLVKQTNLPVLCFDDIVYSPEYFLRDFHHLDKQLTFAMQMGENDYELAQSTLSSLFPDEFMDDNTSELSQLHLSSLKFQFLHDLNTSAVHPDADELNRINARDILSCKTHRDLMALMLRIISELNALPSRQSEEYDMQIDEIKTYIRNNAWDKQLSVASVADAFHLSSNALSKLFSRKANMGVLQYIHKIRIENACSLLLTDDNSNIADIALQVGYASTLTFNRAFKARYNMTPSEYRRVHKNAVN